MSWCLSPDLLEEIKISKINANKYQIENKISKIKRQALPEEVIRQLMYIKLIKHYHFNPKLIYLEFPIQMGSSKKRADIVVTENNNPLIIIEVKEKIKASSIEQLHSYLRVTSAKYGILGDSESIFFYEKSQNNKIFETSDIFLGSYHRNNDVKNSTKNNFGVECLIKEVFDDIKEEKWFINIKGNKIEISLKEIQNFQKVQSLALDIGLSLLNETPLHSEWKAFLHSLIQNAVVVNKKDPFKESEEYKFFLDVVEIFTVNKLDILQYFSIRKDGTINCKFNQIYKLYEIYKNQKNEPFLKKKTLIHILMNKKIIVQSGITCNINGKSARACVFSPSLLPKEFTGFIFQNEDYM